MEQEEKLCDEVETVREFTYFGDRVSVGGGCEVVVTARTGCGLSFNFYKLNFFNTASQLCRNKHNVELHKIPFDLEKL